MWMMGHTSAGKEGSTEDVKGRGVAISLWAGIIRSVVACLFEEREPLSLLSKTRLSPLDGILRKSGTFEYSYSGTPQLLSE